MINRNFEDVSLVSFKILTKNAPGWAGTWAVEDIITHRQFIIIPFGRIAELRYTTDYTSSIANNTFGAIASIKKSGNLSDDVIVKFEQKINKSIMVRLNCDENDDENQV